MSYQRLDEVRKLHSRIKICPFERKRPKSACGVYIFRLKHEDKGIRIYISPHKLVDHGVLMALLTVKNW